MAFEALSLHRSPNVSYRVFVAVQALQHVFTTPQGVPCHCVMVLRSWQLFATARYHAHSQMHAQAIILILRVCVQWFLLNGPYTMFSTAEC